MHIKDIHTDEIRCDFLVTTDRKKVWQVELELLAEFDRICRKYGLRYFADYGTLLGAARHKGFIPWDDDIDVTMMRPDYERLKQIMKQERLPEPFFFQTAYTDNVGLFIAKLMNKNTSGVQDFSTDKYCQGIFLDIWPLDAALDGSGHMENMKTCYQELMYTVLNPEELMGKLQAGAESTISPAALQQLCRLPFEEKWQQLETFLCKHFHDSDSVAVFMYLLNGKETGIDKSLYKDIVMLEFEGMKIPAPARYEEILNIRYGDWHKWVKFASEHNGTVFSADIPYKDLIAAYQGEGNL